MKIALFSRDRVRHEASQIKRIFACIEQYSLQYCVNEEFAPIITSLTGRAIEPSQIYGQKVGAMPAGSVMLCYGGDGTILEGLHRLGGQSIAVVGINSGRLGFLTSGTGEDIEQIFENIANGNLKVESRKMVNIKGDFIPDCTALLAANELAVQRLGATMIAVDVWVDNQAVATYYGDGVIISTPTGSTAYSLSAGGPIVAPDCECFIISPLAPHNLAMRPVVVRDSSQIRLHITTREGDAAISLDNRTFPIGKETNIELSLSEKKFLLATKSNISFFQTLKEKMMWGLDPRDKNYK